MKSSDSTDFQPETVTSKELLEGLRASIDYPNIVFDNFAVLSSTGSFLQNTAKYLIRPGKVFLSGAYDFHSILPEAIIKPITYYAFLFLHKAIRKGEYLRFLYFCL